MGAVSMYTRHLRVLACDERATTGVFCDEEFVVAEGYPIRDFVDNAMACGWEVTEEWMSRCPKHRGGKS